MEDKEGAVVLGCDDVTVLLVPGFSIDVVVVEGREDLVERESLDFMVDVAPEATEAEVEFDVVADEKEL